MQNQTQYKKLEYIPVWARRQVGDFLTHCLKIVKYSSAYYVVWITITVFFVFYSINEYHYLLEYQTRWDLNSATERLFLWHYFQMHMFGPIIATMEVAITSVFGVTMLLVWDLFSILASFLSHIHSEANTSQARLTSLAGIHIAPHFARLIFLTSIPFFAAISVYWVWLLNKYDSFSKALPDLVSSATILLSLLVLSMYTIFYFLLTKKQRSGKRSNREVLQRYFLSRESMLRHRITGFVAITFLFLLAKFAVPFLLNSLVFVGDRGAEYINENLELRRDFPIIAQVIHEQNLSEDILHPDKISESWGYEEFRISKNTEISAEILPSIFNLLSLIVLLLMVAPIILKCFLIGRWKGMLKITIITVESFLGALLFEYVAKNWFYENTQEFMGSYHIFLLSFTFFGLAQSTFSYDKTC